MSKNMSLYDSELPSECNGHIAEKQQVKSYFQSSVKSNQAIILLLVLLQFEIAKLSNC